METSSESGSVTREISVVRTLAKKQEKYDDDKDSSFKKRLFHVADRAFDKAALAENIRGDFDVRRQILL